MTARLIGAVTQDAETAQTVREAKRPVREMSFLTGSKTNENAAPTVKDEVTI